MQNWITWIYWIIKVTVNTYTFKTINSPEIGYFLQFKLAKILGVGIRIDYRRQYASTLT